MQNKAGLELYQYRRDVKSIMIDVLPLIFIIIISDYFIQLSS